MWNKFVGTYWTRTNKPSYLQCCFRLSKKKREHSPFAFNYFELDIFQLEHCNRLFVRPRWPCVLLCTYVNVKLIQSWSMVGLSYGRHSHITSCRTTATSLTWIHSPLCLIGIFRHCKDRDFLPLQLAMVHNIFCINTSQPLEERRTHKICSNKQHDRRAYRRIEWRHRNRRYLSVPFV